MKLYLKMRLRKKTRYDIDVLGWSTEKQRNSAEIAVFLYLIVVYNVGRSLELNWR